MRSRPKKTPQVQFRSRPRKNESHMETAKTIELELTSGQHVELQMSSQLVDQIMKAFNLPSPDDVSPQHVKLYLISGMKKALGDTNERRHTS